MSSYSTKLGTGVRYNGWESLELSNAYTRVNIVPELGGRIMNYQLDSHRFLWVNTSLEGQLSPASGLAPDGTWLNWGGDKLWLAPQGWDNSEQWPGPPDPVLDGGKYQAEVVQQEEGSCAIQLTSPPNACTGMQLSRTVHLQEHSSHVNIVATMTNIGTIARRWGIWSVTQLNVGNRDGEGWNPEIRTYVPVDADRHNGQGYRVMYGEVNNPQFRLIDGLLQTHYERMVGKVGLESAAGWVATVDGRSGNVFVQRARYEADAEYPDGASIEIWTNGLVW